MKNGVHRQSVSRTTFCICLTFRFAYTNISIEIVAQVKQTERHRIVLYARLEFLRPKKQAHTCTESTTQFHLICDIQLAKATANEQSKFIVWNFQLRFVVVVLVIYDLKFSKRTL